MNGWLDLLKRCLSRVGLYVRTLGKMVDDLWGHELYRDHPARLRSLVWRRVPNLLEKCRYVLKWLVLGDDDNE